MSHLTIDEIIEFVTLDKLNDQAMKILTKVNAHIRECDECMYKVKVFQQLYDKLKNISKPCELKTDILEELEAMEYLESLEEIEQ